MLADNVDSWTDQWKQEGIAKGIEKGLEQGRETTRHILVRQVRLRFGAAAAEQTAPLLARITDLQQLEELGDHLLTSADGDDWLQAVRNICAGHEQ